MKEFDEELFINTINSIPHWVKTKEDALKYASHLHYRALQSRAQVDFLLHEIKKYDEEFLEDIELKYLEIYNQYDKSYNNQEK